MRGLSLTTFSLLAAICSLSSPVVARDSIVIAVGLTDQQTGELNQASSVAGVDFVAIHDSVFKHVDSLMADIERGRIFESGVRSPPSLRPFSEAVIAAVPQIFSYKYIRVLSSKLIPIELVQRDQEFLGDRVIVSHEFSTNPSQLLQLPKTIPFATYLIDAVIGMSAGMRRIDQDIVQTALALEHYFSVELRLHADSTGFKSMLERSDLSILHIDTHGGNSGFAIQIGRDGAMMEANELPSRISIPLVMLFGCEGVAGVSSFGAAMHERGVEAVISAFAKFTSFGITGDPAREKQVYSAFFDGLLAGEDVGSALLHFRQAALAEAAARNDTRTLTRLFFVLVGNSGLKFTFATR